MYDYRSIFTAAERRVPCRGCGAHDDRQRQTAPDSDSTGSPEGSIFTLRDSRVHLIPLDMYSIDSVSAGVVHIFDSRAACRMLNQVS